MRIPQGSIIVLGEDSDLHVELVQKHLDTPLVVINASGVAGGLAYGFGRSDAQPVVMYAGERLDLSAAVVQSVWYRTVSVRRLRPNVRIDPPEQQEYAVSSLQSLADGLLAVLPESALWVSDWRAVLRAEAKPYQLLCARQVGLNVPETLFASDAGEAKRFVQRQSGRCVVKTLANRVPVGYDQLTVVRAVPELDFAGLEVNPQIFQQLIDPVLEVRVAVIGTEVFASVVEDAAAGAAEELGIRDFRRAFHTGTFCTRPFGLPRALARASVELVWRLGLMCGFMDLMCDRSGQWWFLEVNPNGEWAFMDDETVEDIAVALARLLVSGQPPW